MYYLKKEMKFDSAHWLKLGYQSPCCNEHGHTWKAVIYCAASDVNESGLIVDFALINSKIKDSLDHKVINRVQPFNILNPTAENIAKVICQWINELCELEVNKPVCYKVEVWETDSNMATYEAEIQK